MAKMMNPEEDRKEFNSTDSGNDKKSEDKKDDKKKIDWHRLFGMTLIDFFDNTVYGVEIEKKLVLDQFIDIVIIKKESGDEIEEVPDGLENLSDYNLVTYKSLRQSLNAWSLDELLSYYVINRKMLAGKDRKLPGDEKFCLYALSTKKPRKLFKQKTFSLLRKGVYEAEWGSRRIRVIVPKKTAKIPRNALWHLLSGREENIRYGAENYNVRSQENKTIIYQILESYQMEGINMAYTREDFFKDFTRIHLDWLTNKERIEGIPVEEILKAIPQEKLEEYLKNIKSDK